MQKTSSRGGARVPFPEQSQHPPAQTCEAGGVPTQPVRGSTGRGEDSPRRRPGPGPHMSTKTMKHQPRPPTSSTVTRMP